MVTSGEPEPARGRQAIRESMAGLSGAFSDLTTEFVTIISDGDRAGAESVTKGTHNGVLASPQGDVQPTGRSVTIHGACLLRVNDAGLIVEDHTYEDTADFARQLGLP